MKRLKVEYNITAPSREQPNSIFIDEQKRMRDTLRAVSDHKQWRFVNLRGAARRDHLLLEDKIRWHGSLRRETARLSRVTAANLRDRRQVNRDNPLVGLHSRNAWEMQSRKIRLHSNWRDAAPCRFVRKQYGEQSPSRSDYLAIPWYLRLLNRRQVKAGIEILRGGLRLGDASVGHEEIADLLLPFHHGAVRIRPLALPG
jgi:hypothetical protein